jgi:hypothetical protein
MIQISLDSSQTFQYQELFSGSDASSITVINGDRIAWILDPAIVNRTLQLDFGIINPFQIFRNVSLRGNGQVVASKVNFPKGYTGNRQLKYTVSLGNGLHDDPDVVPVESDGGLIQGLGLGADVKIQWTDASQQAILLNPGDESKSCGGAATVAVTWKWNVGANDPTPPFDLEFTTPPPGWPAGIVSSTDTDPTITLSLPPGRRTEYTISTTSGDGSQEISADGHLTVTA